ncbi:MAG TPA: PLP-dependent aminotransferase family protein [Chloroflexaceae bacterium]|nr:PLP-dependent aminotransferase family protein [Chloroflexaceae bacterium]
MQLSDLYAARARDAAPPMWGPSPAAGAIPIISLAYGFADPAFFPREELVEATAQALADDVGATLNYGPSAPALYTLVAERLAREGVAAHEDQILLAYGSGQVLGLLPRVLVEPGDTVLVEAPTFMGAVRQFGRAGARLVGVPVGAQGLDPDALEATLADLARRGVRPKFLYSIPTFQNPAGATLSLEGRRRVVALAARYGVLVVEDDAYVDLRFSGEALPPMAALDEEWVLRVGTFSKILAPGLRMGWAHGPKGLIERLQMFKLEGGSGPFLTHLVARFAHDGRLDRHIEALRAHYAVKCERLATALRREVPDGDFITPEGGFFIWLRLPAGMTASELAPVALRHGVEVLPGTRCFADGGGEQHIRLAFSEAPLDELDEGARRLGAAIGELRARPM